MQHVATWRKVVRHCDGLLLISVLDAGLDAWPTLDGLTSLLLLGTAVDDRGCRNLVPALPQLVELALGSKAVGDKGLRALCSLPKASTGCSGHLRM